MRLVRKSESVFMRFLAFLLRPIAPTFMLDFWTTVGRTVYVPTKYDDDHNWGSPSWRLDHIEVIAHEEVHVDQVDRWTLPVQALLVLGPSPFLGVAAGVLAFFSKTALIVGAAAILTLPLSFGLAWGRWRVEREAYLVQIAASGNKAATIESIVQSLWSHYGWCWPRAWMRAWFKSKAL